MSKFSVSLIIHTDYSLLFKTVWSPLGSNIIISWLNQRVGQADIILSFSKLLVSESSFALTEDQKRVAQDEEIFLIGHFYDIRVVRNSV